MNSLFEDYKKQTSEITSVGEALILLEDIYEIDPDEVADLYVIFHELIVDKLKSSSHRCKSKDKHINEKVELMLDAFFFGMFVADETCWNWPDKK